jgi:protein phosphatase
MSGDILSGSAARSMRTAAGQTIEVAVRTHVGLLRAVNEDHVVARPELGLVVVADGMGGHRGGDIASQLAVDVVQSELADLEQASPADVAEGLIRVGQAVESANASVFRLGRAEPALSGMGTTVVVALMLPDRLLYAHVGDSRLYRMRQGELQVLTTDHSLIQEMVDLGFYQNKEEALTAGVGEHVITRCLGLDMAVDVDLGDDPMEPGDIYLACTDGLCGQVRDADIGRILAQPRADLDGMAEELVLAALANGGRDNISLALLRAVPAADCGPLAT